MPGLVGIVSINGDQVSAGLIAAMRDAIRHRDWYKTDDYTNTAGTAAVSRVHLGIIHKDRQPHSAHDGRLKIFLHGEIYNDEMANGNVLEYIGHLYEKEGLNFASFLNGSFVIVIVDEAKDIVLVANDRLASRPLFYYGDGRAIYFGPEMKSILLVPSLHRNLNLAAVADFLANGYFSLEHTLIEGLETVDKATVLKITPGGVARHKYWECDFEQGGTDRGREYYQETLAELLRKAVRRCVRTEHTYGVLLSGGYDSRGILGCYLEAKGQRDLHTISWGREEDIPESDCAIAKALAQKLGADHRFYKLTEKVVDDFRDFIRLGEGLTWWPESYEVFHRIREQQGVEIVLRGDESFGDIGVMVHDEQTVFHSLFLDNLRFSKSYQRILMPSYYDMFYGFCTEMLRQLSLKCSAKNLHNRKDFFNLDVYLKHYLNPLNYGKTFEIESFTPWLDHDLLDFVCALPVRYRLDKNLYRRTVVGMFPDLFEKVATRRNDIDWPAWFRNSPKLQQLVYTELIETQNAFSEFINMDSLKSELDALTSPISSASLGRHNLRAKVKAGGIVLRRISPAAFDLAHRSVYTVGKWLGKPRDPLPPNRAILRLLILKVWGDVFLNYPMVKTTDHVPSESHGSSC
jgi:asparagine synthetase B (glutamine-hydrolysing)